MRTKNQPENTQMLALIEIGDPTRLTNIQVPDSQKKLLADSASGITSLQSVLATLERRAEKLKAKIDNFPESIKLKQTKETIKQVKNGLRDGTNRYNGIFETLLTEVPGEDLAEKYMNFKAYITEANNG